MKLFLNLSKEEQRIRFLKRIDVPERNWKFSAADVRERRRWDDYQDAFSRMLSATSTEHAPWYVIPADHKWFARICAGAVLAHTLIDIDPQFPTVDADAVRALGDGRRGTRGGGARRAPRPTPSPPRTTATGTADGTSGHGHGNGARPKRARGDDGRGPARRADRETEAGWTRSTHRRAPPRPTAPGTRGRPPTSRRPSGVDPDGRPVGGDGRGAAARQRAERAPGGAAEAGLAALPRASTAATCRSSWSAAAVVSLLIAEWGTAVLLLVLTVLNAVIGLRQEGKAESAMNALKSMMKATARVRRDGDGGRDPRRGARRRRRRPARRRGPGAGRRPHRRGQRAADRRVRAHRRELARGQGRRGPARAPGWARATRPTWRS